MLEHDCSHVQPNAVSTTYISRILYSTVGAKLFTLYKRKQTKELIQEKILVSFAIFSRTMHQICEIYPADLHKEWDTLRRGITCSFADRSVVRC